VSIVYIFNFNPKSEKSDQICGRFPKEKHIMTDNVVWQVLELPNKGFMKIMNAYLDQRQNQSVVRINVNSPFLENQKDSFNCQFWFANSSQPYIVGVSNIRTLWFVNKGWV
jgi:hypothetical protein